MDIPESYKIVNIDARVLKPIMKELGEEYNLKIEKKYGSTGGRGRSRVVGFEFRFSKDSKEKIEEAEKMKKEDNKTKTENKKKEVKISSYNPKFLKFEREEIKEKKELSLREKIAEKIKMTKEYILKNNSFLEGYTKNGTKNNDASLTKEIRNKLEKKQKILNRLEVIYNFNDDEIEKDLKEMVEELLEI